VKVKLSKAAETGGKKYKSGDVVDVSDQVGQKLLDRGLGKLDTGKAKED
tara:strand:- start:511 stop:657 length:147 start_codon:yes stop_codon:yes gene_type:complete